MFEATKPPLHYLADGRSGQSGTAFNSDRLKEASREAGWDSVATVDDPELTNASYESKEPGAQPRQIKVPVEFIPSAFTQSINQVTPYRHWGINE